MIPLRDQIIIQIMRNRMVDRPRGRHRVQTSPDVVPHQDVGELKGTGSSEESDAE